MLQQVNKQQCLIWTTDNNGQISKLTTQNERTEIGNWAYVKNQNQEMGKNLQKYVTNTCSARRTHILYPVNKKNKTFAHGTTLKMEHTKT